MIRITDDNIIHITKTKEPVIYSIQIGEMGTKAELKEMFFEDIHLEYREATYDEVDKIGGFKERNIVSLDSKPHNWTENRKYYAIHVSPEDMSSLLGELIEYEEEHGVDDEDMRVVLE